MTAASTHAARAAPPPRWERRKDARPGELLDAALDLFVERGYAATRLDDVATRAGVSKGTLYLYYAGKEDLFKAVVRRNILPLIEAFERDVAESSVRSGDLLDRFFRHWWSSFGSTRLASIAKLVVGEAGNFPELAQFFQLEIVARNAALLRSIVERGVRQHEFRPVDVEASIHLWMAPLVLRAIWAQSILPCCPTSLEVPVERMLDAHVRYVLDALEPRPALPAPRGTS